MHSNNLKVDQTSIKQVITLFFSEIYDHVSDCSFDSLCKGSSVHFWSEFEERYWSKSLPGNQIQHMSSLKDFSGQKIDSIKVDHLKLRI